MSTSYQNWNVKNFDQVPHGGLEKGDRVVCTPRPGETVTAGEALQVQTPIAPGTLGTVVRLAFLAWTSVPISDVVNVAWDGIEDNCWHDKAAAVNVRDLSLA